MHTRGPHKQEDVVFLNVLPVLGGEGFKRKMTHCFLVFLTRSSFTLLLWMFHHEEEEKLLFYI